MAKADAIEIVADGADEQARKVLAAIAAAIDQVYNDERKGFEPVTGFALLIFPLDRSAAAGGYASNAGRVRAVAAFKQQIERFETGGNNV